MKHSALPQKDPPTALSLSRVALRVLIVLNGVLGGLIIALLVSSFLAADWTFRALGVGALAGHARLVAGMRAIMGIGLAGVPLAHVALARLLFIVESVRTGEPFSADNARRLKAIAWALLGLESLRVVVAAIASALSTREAPLHLGGNVQVSGWLAVLLLFVLAQVFLEGTRMREDLEGTI